MRMICFALPAVAIVTPVRFFYDSVDLLIILPPECLMHLTPQAMLNLMLMVLCKGAISHLRVKIFLKVFCNRLKHLITKTLPTVNILCAILRVEGHVEPLEL
jgi:hypothetical protein